MQLTRNTLIPMAMGMLAIATARAEAQPLVAPGAGGAPARAAVGSALLWGLDFVAREASAESAAANDEAAPAIPASACLGEDADGAIACEDGDCSTDEAGEADEACEPCDACPEGCGILEAGWGGAEEVSLEAGAEDMGWIERAVQDACDAPTFEACDAPTFDAPTFEAARAPTFGAWLEIPGLDVPSSAGEPASVSLPSVEPTQASLPVYVALCQAVIDAVKADIAAEEEAPSGVEEPADEEADLVMGEPCCDDAAAGATGDADATAEVFGVDEQADLTALVACSDARGAVAAASSLKRGIVRFFETLLRERLERPDASFEAAAAVEEVVDAPAREFEEGHVPEVLTLF